VKLDGVHFLSFAIGLVVGWLVLPMILGMFSKRP
jgi:hypothetical protein